MNDLCCFQWFGFFLFGYGLIGLQVFFNLLIVDLVYVDQLLYVFMYGGYVFLLWFLGGFLLRFFQWFLGFYEVSLI